jgi:hypothetical protein
VLAVVIVLVGAAILASIAPLLSARSAAIAPRQPEHYVALGDSYAAGPGILGPDRR